MIGISKKKPKFSPVGPNGTVDSWSSTDTSIHKKEHIWTISHYSFQDARKKKLRSSTFTSDFDGMNTCTWYLTLKPRGAPKGDDFISLYLKLDPSSECKNVYAKLRFSIMNSEQIETHHLETSIHKYAIGDNGKSLIFRRDNKFLKRNVLFNAKDELLPNDKLTIFCQITYSQVIFTNSYHQSDSITHQPSPPNNRLSKDFESLLNNKDFADVIISVDGVEYQALKAVLAARSSVFSAMFKTNGMQESVKNRIEITDISQNVLEEMLRYIYTGNVNNLHELADELFEAADKYDLDELKEMCLNFMSSNLSVDTAAKTLILADLHHADELKSKTMNYIVMNACKVMCTEGWKYVVASNVLINEVCSALSRK